MGFACRGPDAATLGTKGATIPAMTAAASPRPRHLPPWVLAGMVAFLPHLLAVILASAQRPGFSHRVQYLSELGERGSATASLTNYLGILPTGLLIACFGLGVLLRFRAQRAMAIAGGLIALRGVLRVVAALFPCDVGCRPALASASQDIHNAAATIAFVALTAAAFTAGAWLRARRHGKAIVVATYALAIVAVAAQVMLLAGAMGSPGLFQRIALGALQLWVALLAIHFAGPGS